MPSRKSLFDTILSGCIPVLFHPLTARFMYEWHWGQELWGEVAISFDSKEQNKALIEHRTDFIAELIKVAYEDKEGVRLRQDKIKEFAYQLQYSLIGADGKVARIEGQKDAYEISMEKILAIHAGKAKHDRVSDYVECMLIAGRDGVDLQTADWCSSTGSTKDPYSPSPFDNFLYKDSI